jgi:hypothetical protein
MIDRSVASNIKALARQAQDILESERAYLDSLLDILRDDNIHTVCMATHRNDPQRCRPSTILEAIISPRNDQLITYS